MSRFTEKQLILITLGVSVLISMGFGALIYMDWQAIYAAEVTDENPEAAEIVDPEQWGERRRIQELQSQIDAARAEADLIPKRERDVVVYREIVNRDAAILPSVDDVNRIATTIGEFERMANVRVSRVSDLNLTANANGQAIRMMPIKLRLSGTFDELLKFINLFENLDRMVNTTGLSITAGQAYGEGRDRRAVHAITLDLTTFIYNSGANLAKPVEIANYERRKNDPVIQKQIRQQKAAYVEKYQLKPRINRRDILVDPRRSLSEVQPEADAKQYEEQKKILEQLKFAIELLKEDVRQEAIYVQERKYVQLAQIKPLIDQKATELELAMTRADPEITVPELREILNDEVMEPFSAIKSQRDLGEGPRVIGANKVLEFAERVRSHMEEREYEVVLRTHTNFLNFIKGVEVHEDAKPYMDEMADMAHEATVMLEFESLDLKVTGMILRTEGSRVIIGGSARKEGDYVDPDNRCRLIKISKHELIFELDGTEITNSIQ